MPVTVAPTAAAMQIRVTTIARNVDEMKNFVERAPPLRLFVFDVT
jgi:hypothetical protein